MVVVLAQPANAATASQAANCFMVACPLCPIAERYEGDSAASMWENTYASVSAQLVALPLFLGRMFGGPRNEPGPATV